MFEVQRVQAVPPSLASDITDPLDICWTVSMAGGGGGPLVGGGPMDVTC